MNLVRPLRLLVAALILLVVPLHAALRVSHLRCDWAVDPVGIDSPAPRLTWQLESVERGARQTAWQIQVATSAAQLARGRANVWDSGRVDGAAQIDVAYRGRPLRTGEQVYWRVRAWDGAREASPWSAMATWTMGVLRPEEWKAQWITDPELLKGTRTKLGFSTHPVANPDTPAWLVVDLGQAYPIDRVVLDGLVHTVTERLGFPEWFKLELANNPQFADATVVADHTREAINTWLTRVALPVPKITGRYLRLTATKLRLSEEEGQRQPVARLALRQLEVISGGRNVAVGAAVTASDSIEAGPWSAASLVDGMEIPGTNPRAADTLLLRHEFTPRSSVKRALLFATGLGSYTLSVNGTPVGADDLLQPDWTESSRRVLYATHDITALVRAGANALGLTLAGGMYNVAEIPGRYTKFVGPPRPLVALAQLRLEYADGTVETVATDPTWKVAPGPVTFAHIYGGEDYDRRREPAGWDRPGFNDTAWRLASPVPGPGGALHGISDAAPPIRIEGTLPVIARHELKPGVTVYDLGQNAALMPRLAVRGVAGSTVKISPAELLRADGTIDPGSAHPAALDASWNYTLAGTGATETWQPQFFYHGARYLQVTCAAPAGAPLPVVERIDGLVIHTSSPAAGEFSCSNELFNRTATLVRWAQANNAVSVLTDCPHRERLGWLEQYHLNGPSLRANFDLTRLYNKCFNDMADAQRPSGLVPDIAPEYVHFGQGFLDSPEWGSSVILAAWQQYVWTGDEASLREHYDSMVRYFAYLGSRASDHLLAHGLGDWYDLGPKPPGVAQLTPIALTASAIYYEDARALSAIARQLGRSADAARFAAEADAIRTAFNARFFDAAQHTYATGSQVSNAMPVVLGLVPPGEKAAVVAHIVDDVRAHNNGLTAGDVGYRYLLRALAGANRSDVIFALNDQSERPGYGYQLKMGATSLTEAWDAGRHSSQDHFMLGQIVEWFYQDLAGLAPDPEAPGFSRALVRPNPVGDVVWAHARYDSVRGPFDVRWRREAGRFTLDVTVPANAHARVELPTPDAAAVQESGVPVEAVTGITPVPRVNGRPAYEIGSGAYHFVCPTDASEP